TAASHTSSRVGAPGSLAPCSSFKRETPSTTSVTGSFFPSRSSICTRYVARSEEHTSELQSHRDLHSFPTRRSSDHSLAPCSSFKRETPSTTSVTGSFFPSRSSICTRYVASQRRQPDWFSRRHGGRPQSPPRRREGCSTGTPPKRSWSQDFWRAPYD